MEQKNHSWRLFTGLFLSGVISLSSALAQVNQPSTWSSFVQSAENTVVSDTFRLQTFNNLSTDNWSYQQAGTTEIISSSASGFTDGSEGYVLKLFPGSTLTMADYEPDLHTDVKLHASYALYNLHAGENLYVSANRATNPLVDKLLFYAKDTTCSFTSKKRGNEKQGTGTHTLVMIGNNPTNFQMKIGSGSETYGGYYAVDSVYVFGDIPNSSLFTGNGTWHETGRWSHQPALRHRTALIQGNVTIDSPVTCGEIHLDNSQLIFTETGTLHVEKSVVVYQQFPQTGQWYLLSFPFDVYKSDVDPAFTLGDDATVDSGNYYYVLEYDGERRATQESSTGNWRVIDATLRDDAILFEKGKGYLVALDEAANRRTLTFSSRSGELPADFGKAGILSIDVTINDAATDETHNGWCLCGNPLPYALSLKQMETNSDLDGSIYIYNGSDYDQWPIGSDHVIPPYGTFFVKAKRNTSLSILSAPTLRSDQATPAPQLFHALSSEPHLPLQSPTHATSPEPNRSVRFSLQGSLLHIDNPSDRVVVTLFSTLGTRMFHQALPAGRHQIPLSLRPGLYVIHLQTAHGNQSQQILWR
ncbi:MAG: hypothetical protein ACI30I_04965 [Parabacteroides sp.]